MLLLNVPIRTRRDLQRAVVAADLRDFGNKDKDITMMDQSNEYAPILMLAAR